MQNPVNYAVGSANTVRAPGDAHYTDYNDICVTMRYQNRTGNPVYVTRRDGLRFKLQPVKRYNISDEVRIYVTYKANRDVIKYSADLLNATPNTGVLHDKILRALNRAWHNSTAREIDATVEMVITEKQLSNSGGRLYLADLDLLIEVGRVTPMAHPYSYNGIDRKRLDSLMPSCSRNTLAFMFKAVDNSGAKIFADRYINIGGMVFRIPVEEDDAYATGIHVVARRSVAVVASEQTNHSDELEPAFYTFDEADKLFGLHLTAEEAKVAGPLVEHMKEQAAIQSARDKLEAVRGEGELQQLRNKQQQQKMELDVHLHDGKTLLEWSKIGLGVFTTAVSILAIWQKLASK